MAGKQRLDQELLQRGLAASRQQAQQLIRAGRVRGGGQVLDKPGTEVAEALVLEVEHPPRSSRGGERSWPAALESLPIRVAGRVCLDGGISTGGFTDCLLQHGAERVYGIDVGYGQTAWSLRNDERVVLKERTNLRHLTPEDLYGEGDPWPDLAVADVSFISLTRVLPALRALLRGPAEAVLLVKPQFEVGRQRVGKGGVVRDPAAHADAITTVMAAARAIDWHPAGLLASPLTGPAGNHEYLLWLAAAGVDQGRLDVRQADAGDWPGRITALVRRHPDPEAEGAPAGADSCGSDGAAVQIAGTDPDDRIDGADEDLSVADLTGAGRILNRLDHRGHLFIVDDDFELEFLQKFDREFGTAIALHLSLLPPEAANFADGHADDPGIDQGDLHILELEGADDGLDFLHGDAAVRRRRVESLRSPRGGGHGSITAEVCRGRRNGCYVGPGPGRSTTGRIGLRRLLYGRNCLLLRPRPMASAVADQTVTPLYGERAIAEAQLICFTNPREGRAYEVSIELPEFTCTCPFSGYPDFAVLRLLYQPGPRVLELKALKLYVNGYRDRAISHEEVANRILDDLVVRLRAGLDAAAS